MAKHEIWTKTRNNWRVRYVEDASAFVGKPDVMVDPNMQQVRGLAPHFYKPAEDGLSFLPMSDDEANAVVADHTVNGVDNQAVAKPSPVIPKVRAEVGGSMLRVALIAAVVSALVSTLMKHF